MNVTLFGVPGNMGSKVLEALVQEEYIEKINLLVNRKKGLKPLIKLLKKNNKKYRIIFGTVSDLNTVIDAIENADYLVNMAAAIPPESDKYPRRAIEANEIGPQVIVKALEMMGDKQPKFIHISTMGLYGDRNYKHPFGEVGDPLLIAPFDIYSLTKLRGEFTVLESNVKCWAVIRQTAMLYDSLMMKNVSDGLMFHTCFNCMLEWSTAKDSAVLIRNIIRKDMKGELNEDNFWKHCFNLGAGKENRVTGYDTFRLGFGIIGCKVEQFFDTNYNSLRNFHGEWFSDGYKLMDLFNYQEDTIEGFWDNVLKTHKYFSLAKLAPKKLLKAVVIKRLLKDENAPFYWKKHEDEARMLAYFNGVKKFNAIPKDWKDFNLLVKGKTPDGEEIDFEKFRSTPTRLEHYFDLDKDRKTVTIEDLRKYAKARGGKLLTKEFKDGDIYSKVEWENADGEKFVARPHTVLYCGHWVNVSYSKYAWDFDKQAKTDKIAAQVWYDSHEENEDRYYWYDSSFKAHYKKID